MIRSVPTSLTLLLALLLASGAPLRAQEPASSVAGAQVNQDAASRLQAVQDVLDARYEVLETVTRDFAHWDDAYLFATGARAGFPGAGLLPPALSRLGIHRMLVLDASFQTRLALTIRASPLGQSLTEADPKVVESIRAAAQAGSLSGREQVWRGLSYTGGSLALIVARPVLRGGNAAPGGWLALAQPLDEVELREALRAAVPDFAEVPLATLTPAQYTQGLRSWLESPGPETALYSEEQGTTLDTWLTLRDLAGRPLWIARLQSRVPVAESAGSTAGGVPADTASTPLPAPDGPARPYTALALLVALLTALGAWLLWRKRRNAPPVNTAATGVSTVLPATPAPSAASVPAPSPGPAQASPTPKPTPTPPPTPPTARPTPTPTPAPAPAAPVTQRREPARGTAPEDVVIMYQPIIDLRTERVWGLAARLRWKEASRGWIEPRDDVRIQTDAGEPLTSGRFVLQTAARDVHHWRAAGVAPSAVSVQFAVSVTSFDDARKGLQQASEQWKVGPETLQVELSVESVLDSRTGRIYRDVVMMWRQLGLPIVVRRWGARRGVQPVPMLDGVDALKLDVRLVNEIDLYPAARETLGELVAQATSRGIPVIAEGVDRRQQLDTLRAVDCHLAQGPLLLHAVAASEVPDLLTAGVFRIRSVDPLEHTDELPRLPELPSSGT